MILNVVLAVAEKILNNYLQLDPETNSRLSKLAGKVIALQSPYSKHQVYCLFTNNRVQLFGQYDGPTDVTLTGTPFDFLALNQAVNNSVAAFKSNVTITGDLEIAQHFKTLFAELDIDWEEQLSQVTGDFMAYQIGNGVRAFSEWAKQTNATMQQNFTEYVQEEVRLTPSKIELEDFLSAVDKLRDDVERLEIRIKKLEYVCASNN